MVHIEKLIIQMSDRLRKLIDWRDQMHSLSKHPQALTVPKRLHYAINYEQIVSRIDELEKAIEALIDARNLDIRKNDSDSIFDAYQKPAITRC